MVIELGPDNAYLRRQEALKREKPIKEEAKIPVPTEDQKHWLASGRGVVSETDIFS
ncbi:hypothetical protein K2P56_03645 [Patescibacteria group bacterium]|nr:hypothetical protein [Patescibacteria group bacterium]